MSHLIKRKEQQSLAARIFRDSTWAFLSKIIGGVSILGYNAVLARVLTKQEFGDFLLIQTGATVFAMIARFGMQQAVVKMVAEAYSRRAVLSDTVSTICAIFVVCAFSTSLMMIIFWTWGFNWYAATFLESASIGSTFVGFALLIMFSAAQVPMSEIFRGLGDVRTASVLNNVMFSGIFLCSLVTVVSQSRGLSLAGAITLAAVAMGFTVLINLLWLLKRFDSAWGTRLSLSVDKVRTVLGVGAPILGIGVINYVFSQSGVLIVGRFGSADSVGEFGASIRLVGLVAVPLLIINMAVQSTVVELHQDGRRRELESALRVTATVAAVPSLILLAVFLTLPELVLRIVFGAEYQAAANLLCILSIGHLMNVITGPCAVVLMMAGHQQALLLLSFFTSTGALIAAIALMQLFGVTGVAWALTIGAGILNLCCLVLVRRKVGIWTHVALRPSTYMSAYKRIKCRL